MQSCSKHFLQRVAVSQQRSVFSRAAFASSSSSSRSRLYLGSAACFCGATYFLSDPPIVRADSAEQKAVIIEKNPTWQYYVLKTLPLRAFSRLWGRLNRLEIPVFAREKVYRFYSWVFGANIDEVEFPLANYSTMNEFFMRRLFPGCRQISSSEAVSPVDAKVTAFGKVTDGVIDQIKGVSVSMSQFLGHNPHLANDKNDLYYIVLYLAPGDYHRIHSSADWKIKHRRHFPGDMFPVAPKIVKVVPDLFCLNERVVLTGEWKHGFYSLSPVAATNVGNIHLCFDPEVQSNLSSQDSDVDSSTPNPHPYPVNDKALRSGGYSRLYENGGFQVARGDEISRFEMGSTVVLVFEAPGFAFQVEEGQKVQMGQSLGYVDAMWVPKNQADALQQKQ